MKTCQTLAGLLLLGIGAVGAAACGDDTSPSGSGTVTFTTWGEDYIETQIPGADFDDGYAIHYDKFLIVIGNIKVADDAGSVVAKRDGFFLINQVEAGTKELVSFDGLDAGNYTQVSYELAPAKKADLTLIGSATDADATLVSDGGYHLYAEGTISKGTVSKTFKWGFGVPTLDKDCEGEMDGKTVQGVVVTDGGEDIVELTCHGDHLFYDDLQSPAAKRRGQAIVDADADMDGEVTLEELAAVSLVDLPNDQYGTGGVDGVNDLRAFVTFLSRTVGHYRGEGECFLTDP